MKALLALLRRLWRPASPPARRPSGPSFTLPPAEETRLSVARFRRAIAGWARLEIEAERLESRRRALRDRGLL